MCDFGEWVEEQMRFTSTGMERPFSHRGMWPGMRAHGRRPGSRAPSADRQVAGGITLGGCSPSRDALGHGRRFALRYAVCKRRKG